ncbi:MAG: hypothetical protein H6573_09015 [Lewinellaceae bacterium]|nr:hypothetical protein [Phaeodactylibacter sp.]MCB9347640.1 hypothetical protein [Lewinellaceae bacterium]
MNNFQELEKEQERQYDASKRMHVQNNLSHTFGLFKFIGQIVDVYLPALVGVLISAAGGSSSETNSQGLSRPPSEGGVHPGQVGPHPPDGDTPGR